jgi:AcrR family transcriptional regulator
VPRSALRQPLTRLAIGEAALALIDRDGADALTMRSLAKHLHCDPMALYRHVDDRDDLLALVAALVIGLIELPDESLEDRAWMLQCLMNMRATFVAHRHVVSIIGLTLLPNVSEHQILTSMIERLTRHPMPDVALADRINALLGASIGYVMVELAEPAHRPMRRAVMSGESVVSEHLAVLESNAFGFRDPTMIVLQPGGFELLARIVVDGVLGSC